MALTIRGLGTATPEHSLSQADAAEMAIGLCCSTAQQTKLLPALYRRTGVQTRHSVILEASTNGAAARQVFYRDAQNEHDAGPATSVRMDRYQSEAGPLAQTAAQRAIEQAGIDPGDVTHLITVSCSGFNAPGFDISLVQHLPLPPGVERTHIGFMGCHGALNGLRVARAFVEADPEAVVLLCAVELCSLHQQYGWEPQQVVANALFADGAAAVVATGDALGSTKADSNMTATRKLVANGSCVLPDSQDYMSWRIQDHGFEMTLSPQLPDLIQRSLAPWLTRWLTRFDLTPDQIAGWAIHPGGPRVLSATGESVELSEEQLQPSRDVLAEYGNMSSPTVLFIYERLMRQEIEGPCILLGFGPGITIEAALLR
ncbi:MAG: type III polyketide synthase [Planctomycetales bacterium]|jgi:predicted naringenin-chalcone synthase